ncbi:GSCOCG00001667001-RA-CDS [Cotesia congregata]|nr:GSCOCG00001667001-RA-CDS [Cotesia congregata]
MQSNKPSNTGAKKVMFPDKKSSPPSSSSSSSKQMKSSTITNAAGLSSLITFTILLLAWISGFASRLFAIIRFESIIHEFDPWFNYRATAYMVQHGFYNFLNWFDERAWYPLGRIVGGTVYPGLMITSGSIHYILHSLNIPVHIRDICVFLAPVFSGLTAISTYFLTKELWSAGAGLFAACFIAIVPGYISRSVAGSYDNEGIAIFALQFTYYLWVKSVKKGSIFWAALTALSYFYMVSAWGGYVFIINLIPLHVFLLLLMNRFSNRLFVSYTTFYILGLLLSMQIPFVGFQPIRTSEHMAAGGVFALLIFVGTLRYLRTILTKSEMKYFGGIVVIIAGVLLLGLVLLTYMGFVAPWSGRFYSLWDTGYAKIHIPIIASVSEHQPTTWFSFFFDLHILVSTFPVGLWYCIKRINDERVFIVLYALSAVYFAGVMVRLMLTLTPVVCMLSGVAFSGLLEMYLKDEDRESGDRENVDSSEAESETDGERSPGRGLYDKAGKLRRMKHEKPKGNGDGLGSNLRNGKAMSSTEPKAYEIMTSLDVDYVLVIFGGMIGYSGDDINKFLWMVRIAEGEHPQDIRESDYFTERGEFRVDAEGSPTLLNCLMYKLSYYRFGEVVLDYRMSAGFDRTRQAEIGNKNFKLTYLDEAYTTEHWLVRIYRVKKPNEFNRPRIPLSERKIARSTSSYHNKKTTRRKKGIIKNKPTVVKGQKPQRRTTV